MDLKQSAPGHRPDLAGEMAEDAGAVDAALGVDPLVGFGTTEMLAAWQQIAADTAANPASVVELYADLAKRLADALLGRGNREPKRGDKRFADPIWESNPFYRGLKQTYLAWTEATENSDRPDRDSIARTSPARGCLSP